MGRASVWSERRDSSQAAVARRRPRDSEGDKCSRVKLHRVRRDARVLPRHVQFGGPARASSNNGLRSTRRAIRRATRDMRPYSCRVARRSLLRTLTRSAHTTTTLSPNPSIRRTPRSTLSRAPALSMTTRAPARLLGHGGRAWRADASARHASRSCSCAAGAVGCRRDGASSLRFSTRRASSPGNIGKNRAARGPQGSSSLTRS